MVGAKDLAVLQSLMLPTFRVEFDVGKGPKAFRDYWGAANSGVTLWEVLGRVLSLGGSFFSPTLFGAPYPFTRFPNDLDPLAHVVAAGANVPLLAMPQPGASQVGSLDHAIVPLAAHLSPPAVVPVASLVELDHPAIGLDFPALGVARFQPLGDHHAALQP